MPGTVTAATALAAYQRKALEVQGRTGAVVAWVQVRGYRYRFR